MKAALAFYEDHRQEIDDDLARRSERAEHSDEEVLDVTCVADRRARAVAALQEIQRRSIESGRNRMSGEEIEAEIEAVRRTRRANDEPG